MVRRAYPTHIHLTSQTLQYPPQLKHSPCTLSARHRVPIALSSSPLSLRILRARAPALHTISDTVCGACSVYVVYDVCEVGGEEGWQICLEMFRGMQPQPQFLNPLADFLRGNV